MSCSPSPVAGVFAYGVRSKGKRDNVVWFWLVSAVVFWLLTLGPQVRWGGNELPIPGPFALVSRLPFFSGNRYPSRYSVMLLLSAAALAVYGLRAVCDRAGSARSRDAAARTYGGRGGPRTGGPVRV